MSIAGYVGTAPDDAPASRGALWRKITRGRNLWALGDQVLISGTNFVTMVLVARGLDLVAFGQFSLVYGGLLFANLLQSALVTQPHNVLGTARFGRKGLDYARYTTATAIGQLFMAAAEAMIALLWVMLARSRGWAAAPVVLALVPSIVAWQLQEFVRRVLYTEGRTGAAFLNDLVSYGGQTLLIAAFWWTKGLTAPLAMYALAITSAAAVALGIWQLRSSLCWQIDLRAWVENWRFGKWLVGSEFLTWCSSLQMYMYVAGWLIGASASGELKAAQILFGPARVISFFLATVLPIQFARKLSGGGNASLQKQMKSMWMLVTPGMGAYCLIVAIFARPLLRLTYGEAYAGGVSVLVLYSGTAFLTYVQMVFAAALTAKHDTRAIFTASLWGAGITFGLSWMLIKLFGIDGALVGMILTGAVVTFLYWTAWRRTMRETPSAAKDVRPIVPAVEAEEVTPSAAA